MIGGCSLIFTCLGFLPVDCPPLAGERGKSGIGLASLLDLGDDLDCLLILLERRLTLDAVFSVLKIDLRCWFLDVRISFCYIIS